MTNHDLHLLKAGDQVRVWKPLHAHGAIAGSTVRVVAVIRQNGVVKAVQVAEAGASDVETWSAEKMTQGAERVEP